jgi:hypothetical protein
MKKLLIMWCLPDSNSVPLAYDPKPLYVLFKNMYLHEFWREYFYLFRFLNENCVCISQFTSSCIMLRPPYFYVLLLSHLNCNHEEPTVWICDLFVLTYSSGYYTDSGHIRSKKGAKSRTIGHDDLPRSADLFHICILFRLYCRIPASLN